jgi:hypothetical protein
MMMNITKYAAFWGEFFSYGFMFSPFIVID